MISLVLAMVWTRRGQAVTLALLALFAVASAVAAPAYLLAVDRAVAAGQVAAAVPAERGLVISGLQNDRNQVEDETGRPGLGFTNVGAALASLPNFSYVYAAEYPTIDIEHDVRYRTRFTYRQDVCAHLTLVTGRCLIGEGEVVVGEQTAARLHLAAGELITLRFATFNPDPRRPRFLPDGLPKRLTVVGTYRVPKPGDGYWGTHGYFATDPGDRPGEPVFTNAATMGSMDHGAAQVSIDGTASDTALDVDHIGELRPGLDNLRVSATKLGSPVTISTKIPDLLERIDSGRRAARLLVPVLAVPLVLLACLSIFLAVGYGTDGRRPELAVVALRGSRWGSRWWLATGESLVAIVVGAVAGCLVGQLMVNAIAAWRFPGVGVAAGVDSLRYAPLAAAAAVVAALLAQRRQLVSPVAELLRRATRTASGVVSGLAVEAAVAALAILAGVQLAISGGTLTGVGTFAPALIVLALALLAARAVLPAVTGYAARALRRGRLGVALAAFQLSRRPGAARLFALLVAAVAVAGYAASAVDVGAQDRVVVSGLGVGADRVVSVEQVSRTRLLTAVRAVDPAGEYAMAVTQLPGGGPDEAPGIAVDSSRLGAVAFWPGDATSATAAARALRPAAPEPILLGGQDLTLDMTSTGFTDDKPVRLSVIVSSVTGLGEAVVQLGQVRPGPYTYQQRAAVCRQGCRVNGIQLATAQGVVGVAGRATLHHLGTINPVRNSVPAAQLADPARWRLSEFGRLSAAPDGLRIDVTAPNGLPGGVWIQPVDTPYPLPVAYAGAAYGTSITGLDGRAVPVDRAVKLPAVPRVGSHATMTDLEYTDRLSTDAALALNPQVWLSANAPADILDKLAERGLVVTADVKAAQVRRQLDAQGPALALWFYVLTGGLATLLAAGALILAAAVDRARRVEDLSALRNQGLGRSPVGRATMWTYPVLVAAAAVVGIVVALLAWWLTGWALPLAGLNPPALPLARWPRPLVVIAAGLVVFAVLAGVAFGTGRNLRRRIDKRDDT
jgi:hypothetical protein